MTETLHLPLPYFPPVSWMAYAVQHQRIVVEGFEYFPKSTCRNHMHIAAANGALKLSIPVLYGRSHHQLYRDTKISHDSQWQIQHWKSITAAYNRSPYFEFYKDELMPFFLHKETYLMQRNWSIAQKLFQLMRVSVEMIEGKEEILNIFPDKDGRMAYGRNAEALQLAPYVQVFADRHGFISDLSVFDLLCNLGPDASAYLMKLTLPPISSLCSK